MDNPAKKQMDAAILREHSVVGDVKRLADKYGVSRLYILNLINQTRLVNEQLRAKAFASSVMKAGEVVYALPANHLQSNTGTKAIVDQLMNTISSVDGHMNVMIAICVIPVEEINCSTTPAIEHPRATAAALQASVVNSARKAVAV